MITLPNAKINIGLHIVEKRPDGYHNIETVFYPIKWCDILEIVPATHQDKPYKLYSSGDEMACDEENNLVVKAWRLIKTAHNIPPIDIFLHKQIPHGAGLGGGSSDAAQMLILLNQQFNLGLSLDELHLLATRLGADCPFFLFNRPLFAQGIGEIFTPVTLTLKDYYIVVVAPPIYISTAAAFRDIIPHKPTIPLSEIIQQPIQRWKEQLINDFEKPLFTQFPLLEKIKNQLYEAGAMYASLSGSGSAIYGIFTHKTDFSQQFNDCKVWQGVCQK